MIFDQVSDLIATQLGKRPAREVAALFNREKKAIYCWEQGGGFHCNVDFVCGLNKLGYDLQLVPLGRKEAEQTMKVPDVKYPIPDDILTNTIEALREFYTRLEIEAAALATLKSPEAEQLAQERLKDAEVAEKLFEFYLNL